MLQNAEFPRVNYTNTAADFSSLHRMLDQELPRFRATLGGRFANRVEGREEWEGEAYTVASPLDDRLLLGTFVEPSDVVVAKAVAAARRGAPGWGSLPWRERVAIMRDVARAIDRDKYELAMAALYEAGKTRIEALGESEEAVNLIEHYCDQLELNDGFVQPAVNSASAEQAQVHLKPFGVFAIVAPFNYPLALVANMAGAALVAGNAVVIKASPAAGLTASMLVKTMEGAGLPEGVINLLCGETSGRRLVGQVGIDGVAFTGSNRTGMTILRQFAAEPFMRPVIGELGGKNHAYVTSKADIGAAVEGVAKSAFAFQGQKCSACSVAFVHSSIYEEFVAALANRARQFKIGNTEQQAINGGPLINKAAVERYERAIEQARQSGAVLHGGNRLRGGAYDHGNFVEPAILVDLPADHRLHKEELFAPVVAVRRFDRLEDAIAVGNTSDFGLTAGLYSCDPAEIDYFQSHVEAGVIYINRATGATTGAWPGIQSFCGWKGSGLTGKGGLGPHYLPQFLREQSVTRRLVPQPSPAA
jgi:1-pyrroline-5-carboxylate dehydrogenase